MSELAQQILQRPHPVPDADSAPFWEACRERRLTVQECTNCGQRRFPPVGVCHRCRNWDHRWVEVTDGTVYSWIVARQSPIASLADAVPYVVAVVDLGSGVKMPTQLVGVALEQVHAGMPVAVRWTETAAGDVLPYFEPRT